MPSPSRHRMLPAHLFCFGPERYFVSPLPRHRIPLRHNHSTTPIFNHRSRSASRDHRAACHHRLVHHTGTAFGQSRQHKDIGLKEFLPHFLTRHPTQEIQMAHHRVITHFIRNITRHSEIITLAGQLLRCHAKIVNALAQISRPRKQDSPFHWLILSCHQMKPHSHRAPPRMPCRCIRKVCQSLDHIHPGT